MLNLREYSTRVTKCGQGLNMCGTHLNAAEPEPSTAAKWRRLAQTTRPTIRYVSRVSNSLLCCTVHQRLLNAWTEATLTFSRTVRALQQEVGSQSFPTRLHATSQVRDACQCCREALCKHRVEHGC